VPAIRNLPERLPTGRVPPPKVSVEVITYNQAQFIAQALDSVLNQKARFQWEIVVGDDYSTDGTREILKSYADRYPERIRLLLHPRRLGPHRPGLEGKHNLLATYRACRGEYVALLEGDDYWTDDYKLEKQVRFLDAHPNCSLCAHAVAVEYSGARGQHWGPVIGGSSKRFYSIEDFLHQEAQISTPSMLFRRSSLGEIPAWFQDEVNGDYALQALLAERGNVGVLPDCMAAHRKHEGGTSRLYDTDPDFYNAAFLDLLVRLNGHFNYRFRSILEPQIENMQRAVGAAALRSLAWSADPTGTRIRLSLDEFVPQGRHLVPGWRRMRRVFRSASQRRAKIVTRSTAWAYAATLRLPTDEVGDDDAGYVRVRARVEGATVGFGVLHRNGDHFIDRCSLEPSEVESEVRLGIPRVEEASELVVQTWAVAKPATVHIESIDLVVFAESSTAADHRGNGAVFPDVVHQVLCTVLAANSGPSVEDDVDPSFFPDGRVPEHSLQDAATRLEETIASAGDLQMVYDKFDEPADRDLLVRLLSYRVLGHRRVQLPVTLEMTRDLYERANMLRTAVGTAPLGLFDALADDFDLNPTGVPVQLRAVAGTIVQAFLVEQYRYRGSPEISARPGDVVIDGGAFLGDTALYFAHLVGPQGRVHAFEFEPGNLGLLEHNLSLNPELARRINVRRTALSDSDGDTVQYFAVGPATTVSPDGDETAPTESIDSLIEQGAIERVDFLKLDIEGCELEALRGAEAALTRFRPRLALAAYHRPDDLTTLTSYLDGLGVGYRFRLGHTTMHDQETVLFAYADPPATSTRVRR
jgi:FkbM family methyltransferase